MYRGETPDGYIHYRDRSNGDDVTVYEHQLMALLDHEPSEVFDRETHVHHVAPSPRANVPGLLDVVDRSEHSSWGGDRHRDPGEIEDLPEPEDVDPLELIRV